MLKIDTKVGFFEELSLGVGASLAKQFHTVNRQQHSRAGQFESPNNAGKSVDQLGKCSQRAVLFKSLNNTQ
jgi:hypothetical protein